VLFTASKGRTVRLYAIPATGGPARLLFKAPGDIAFVVASPQRAVVSVLKSGRNVTYVGPPGGPYTRLASQFFSGVQVDADRVFTVTDGDAEQFAAPISPSAQRLGVHPSHPCLWFSSREHPSGGDVLKNSLNCSAFLSCGGPICARIPHDCGDDRYRRQFRHIRPLRCGLSGNVGECLKPRVEIQRIQLVARQLNKLLAADWLQIGCRFSQAPPDPL